MFESKIAGVFCLRGIIQTWACRQQPMGAGVQIPGMDCHQFKELETPWCVRGSILQLFTALKP